MFRIIGGDKSPFSKGHVWVEIPDQLQFIHIEDPYEVDILATPPAPSTPIGPPHQALGSPSPEYEISAPVTPYLPSPSQFVSPSITEPPELSYDTPSPLDPIAEQTARLRNTDTDPETDFHFLASELLRHFRDGPGQWMDIFDPNAYFSCRIPILAASKSMLRAAICSLSAKHLHRTQRSLTHGGHHLVSGYQHPNLGYKTVEFYDEAVRQLKAAIAEQDEASSAPFPEYVHATVAILCMFELMDEPGSEWKAHLSALPLLLNPKATVVPDEARLRHCVHANRSVFWSLARQDCLSAFVNETQTCIDFDNIDLWKNVGLDINDDGFLVREFDHERDSVGPILTDCELAHVAEASKSQELFWINGKVVNYISQGDGISPGDYEKPAPLRSSIGVTQETLLERWKCLERELNEWRATCSPTHEPYARTPHSLTVVLDGAAMTVPGFEVIWYSIPICAATMMSFHMICILVCMNKPHESTARSTITCRMNEYRRAHDDAQRHGREICGISLSRLQDSVRIHSVQPLFVAGQCFYEPEERQLVVELLQGVERATGWATGFQIQKLRREWCIADGYYERR